MFSLIDVGERSGSGLCDLFNNWKEFGFKTPVLCETVDPDRISLTLEIEIDSNRDRNDSKHDSNERNDNSNLTENEAKVITILRRDGSVSALQVSEETGISAASVNRVYKSLKNKAYRFKEARIQSGKSVAEVAKLLQVAETSVRNWDNGYKKPSLDLLVRLTDLYGVTTDYLLGGLFLPCHPNWNIRRSLRTRSRRFMGSRYGTNAAAGAWSTAWNGRFISSADIPSLSQIP